MPTITKNWFSIYIKIEHIMWCRNILFNRERGVEPRKNGERLINSKINN